MKVRTTLYPNGGERRGHTLHRDWDMADSSFPANAEEASKRSVQAMRHWLKTDPLPFVKTVFSTSGDEFIAEGENWKVEWRKGAAIQRYSAEVAAIQSGDNDAYWQAAINRKLFLQQPTNT